MNCIKNCFLIALMIGLVGCASTPKELEEEKKDREAARINVQLAAGYIRRGNLEVAEQKLQKALEFDDQFVPAYTTLAVLMAMLDQPVEAENYYLEALEIDPRDPELRNNYGTFLCNAGKYDDAFEQFNKALRNQFYETPYAAHANMGYCLMQGENPDFKAAEKHLRKALAVKPNLVSALIAMGELGIETKKYLMARAYMQRYHSVTRPTSHSLWIQIQAEYALGDKQHFLKLSRKLLKQYPESKEAQKVMEFSER